MKSLPTSIACLALVVLVVGPAVATPRPRQQTQGAECCAVEGPTIIPVQNPDCPLVLGPFTYKPGKCEFGCSDLLTPCKLTGTINDVPVFLASNCGFPDEEYVDCDQGYYVIRMDCADSFDRRAFRSSNAK
jgi:hypothetical protein